MNIMDLDWNKILYNSGDFFLPKSFIKILDKNIYMSVNNSFYINGWTIIHYFSGLLLGFLYLYLYKNIYFYYYILFIIHTLWELWQIFIGMAKPWKLTGSSNLIDTFVDTFFFMFGTYTILQLFTSYNYI